MRFVAFSLFIWMLFVYGVLTYQTILLLLKKNHLLMSDNYWNWMLGTHAVIIFVMLILSTFNSPSDLGFK